MASVSRSRFIDAPPEVVERAITEDVAAVMRAANYDSVRFEAGRLELEQTLGLASLSLTLREIDDADATLAFEQVEGHFERMTTEYDVEPTGGGTTLSARTEFTLGGITGDVLDETLVRRQRGRELEVQLEYVERVVRE
ncbi:MAG: SRPBCC family protein [Halanaeroarchaeum sp.]